MCMKVVVLSSKQLEELIEPELLMDEIAKAFKMYSEGSTVMPPRTVMWVEGNWWGIMQAFVPNYGVGVKVVNLIPSNVERGLPTIQALVTLFDASTGSPLAVIEGSVLTALRTAAASGVSARLMAPREPGAIAVIGTGFQARYQLRFISRVFKPTEVRIYDIRREAMKGFKEFAAKLGFGVTECSSSSEAVKGARVVIEATTTEKPVIHGKDLEPPVHVISIGAPMPHARALDDDVLKLAEVVVVDSREAVLKETGDIIEPVKKGILNADDIAELGEVVSGKKLGRLGRGVTVYKSVGLAIQDACAASLAYRLASSRRVGSLVEL